MVHMGRHPTPNEDRSRSKNEQDIVGHTDKIHHEKQVAENRARKKSDD